eukprot:g39216.t1
MPVAQCHLPQQTRTHPSVTAADIRSVFLGVNPRKVTCSDKAPINVLRSCVDQLEEVFIDFFNLSILQANVPNCFRKTTIISVPIKAHAVCLNDYCPVALISIITKCFQRLLMPHIKSSIPTCLDPLQSAYRCNRSTADAISLALLSSLEHLDNKNT